MFNVQQMLTCRNIPELARVVGCSGCDQGVIWIDHDRMNSAMTEFAAALDEVNAVAERSSGFV